jgi:two-component system KDP operon response regulator KdpE
MGELLARVRVALRHARQEKEHADSRYQFGDLIVDIGRRIVTVRGTEVHLSPTEYSLLTYLVRNAGKVLTHRSILLNVWGPEESEETQYLRVYIRHLRQKLEPDPTHPRYILTEPAIGYRFQAE